MSTDPKPDIYLDVYRQNDGNRELIHEYEGITNLMEGDLQEHDTLRLPREHFICNQPEYDSNDWICQTCCPRFGSPPAKWENNVIQIPKGWIGKVPVSVNCRKKGQKGRDLDWGQRWELDLRPSHASKEAAKQMIEDVEGFLRGLTRDLYAPIYSYSYLDFLEYQSTLHDRLRLILKVVDDLIPTIHRLSPIHHSRVKTIEKIQRVESLRRFDSRVVERLMRHPVVVNALTSEQNPFKLTKIPRAYLQLPISEPSPDIYEHRFIRWFMDRLFTELQDLIGDLQISLRELEKEINRAKMKNWQNDVDDYEQRCAINSRLIHKAEMAICRLQRIIQTTFLAEIPSLNGHPQMTHLLHRSPVYRKIYELYILLFQDLRVELDLLFREELFRQSLEKTWQIYEYWGLVCTDNVLRNQLGFQFSGDNSLLKRMGSRLYVQIDKGTQFPFTKGNLEVRLYFSYDHRKHEKPYFRFQWLPKPNSHSKNHHSIPDLHLCFLQNGSEYLGSIILDTKWKSLVHCHFGTESYGQIEYYQEAISAIGPSKPIWSYVLFAGETGDKSVTHYDDRKLGCVLLSPDDKEESRNRLCNVIRDFLDEIGVSLKK